MMRRRPSLYLAAAALLVGPLTLTGCGSSSGSSSTTKPAICADINALKSSVDDLKKVNITQNGLASLQTSLTKVQSDLKQVTSDAKKQYASQVDAIDKAASSLGASLQAATSNPSGQTVAAVGTAVKALGASLTTLEDAVKSTC